MISVTHKFNPVSKELSFTAQVSPDFSAQDELYKALLNAKYRAEVSILPLGSSGTITVTVLPVPVDDEFGQEKLEKPEKPEKPSPELPLSPKPKKL